MTTELESRAFDPVAVATARDGGLTAAQATALSDTLSLLSEPTRLRVLYALDQVDEISVGDLGLALGVGDDAVSYALRLLRTAGLVSSRKVGRAVMYRLAPDFPEPLLSHCWITLVGLSETTRQSETTRKSETTGEDA